MQEEQELSSIGSDVKALFPSIKSESTGKFVREAVQKISLDLQGYDIENVQAYVAMNTHLISNLEEIAHLLPVRISGRTDNLKISAIQKDWNPENKFGFKKQELSSQECKMVLARVVEISTWNLQ